jgi:hypothetical protein
MSVIHPYPSPREIFPASHPAIKPITIQPSRLRWYSTTTTRDSKTVANIVAIMLPPQSCLCGRNNGG